ncbi:MAG: ferredoxin III, nif-specific [Terracidiphilus sp.]
MATQAELPTLTRGGSAWSPSYLLDINQETCIGCGRCFKVCGRNVMMLKGLTEDGELVEIDDESEEFERKVMLVTDPGACIGCAACSRVCPKACQTHGPA